MLDAREKLGKNVIVTETRILGLYLDYLEAKLYLFLRPFAQLREIGRPKAIDPPGSRITVREKKRPQG